MIQRTPLLERSQASYASQKEASFRGGKFNRHTPREGHWLPGSVEPKHFEGKAKKNPRGKHRKRAGSFLRDEPIRHRAEPIRKHIRSGLDLARAKLLLDNALVEADAHIRRLERQAQMGDSTAAAHLHRERLRTDSERYAHDLRQRVESEADQKRPRQPADFEIVKHDYHERNLLSPKTLNHYHEALHTAHPHVVKAMNHWLKHTDPEDLRHSRHLTHTEDWSRLEHFRKAAKDTGHDPVFFMSKPNPAHALPGLSKQASHYRHVTRIVHAAGGSETDDDGADHDGAVRFRFQHWDHSEPHDSKRTPWIYEPHPKDKPNAASKRVRRIAHHCASVINTVYPNAKLGHHEYYVPHTYMDGSEGSTHVEVHNTADLHAGRKMNEWLTRSALLLDDHKPT